MADSMTLRGFVASEVKNSTTATGTLTASFRMGCTDRHYDRKENKWVDGDTNWFTVQCYRQLAGNIAGSIKKGQRVLVVGRLRLRSWENEGKVYHLAQIDAESVGHDLMWGTANYQRTSLAAAAEPSEPGSEHNQRIDGHEVNVETGEIRELSGTEENDDAELADQGLADQEVAGSAGDERHEAQLSGEEGTTPGPKLPLSARSGAAA